MQHFGEVTAELLLDRHRDNHEVEIGHADPRLHVLERVFQIEAVGHLVECDPELCSNRIGHFLGDDAHRRSHRMPGPQAPHGHVDGIGKLLLETIHPATPQHIEAEHRDYQSKSSRRAESHHERLPQHDRRDEPDRTESEHHQADPARLGIESRLDNQILEPAEQPIGVAEGPCAPQADEDGLARRPGGEHAQPPVRIAAPTAQIHHQEIHTLDEQDATQTEEAVEQIGVVEGHARGPNQGPGRGRSSAAGC